MAINLICPDCKSNLAVGSKVCKNCGYVFNNGRKYRVIVKGKNGKRITKVVASISMAKKFESRLKTQVLENNLLGIRKVPTVDSVWEKYLSWAKDNKKSWKDDETRWDCHVHPHLTGKKMDAVTGFDVQRVINGMKAKKDYAPATIKHVVVLVRRVYNWAGDMDLYEGVNPATKIKLPKLNNEVTECLTKAEINRLLNTLHTWKNRRAALLVEFALFTGLRRGDLFSLK